MRNQENRSRKGVKEQRRGKKRKPRKNSLRKANRGRRLPSRGRKGRRNRKTAPKRRKHHYPHYIRGVPRRAGRTREKGLREIYGVGKEKASEVRKATGVSPFVRVGNLKPYQVQLIEAWVSENLRCSSDRRRREDRSLQRHLKLGTVRGMNMRRGLPVRGQRTSTNGMTARRLNKQRGTKVR